MNPTRRFLACLPLAAFVAVAGCQKYAAAEVRRGHDLPWARLAPSKGILPLGASDLDWRGVRVPLAA